MTILPVLLLTLLAMFAMAEVLRKLRVPRVVSYVLTGMVLGIPVISTNIFTEANMAVINFLSDMGVITLLFFVGLQINITHISKKIVPSMSVSLFNTVIPVVLGYVASRYFFHLGSAESLVIGVCLSVSATAVALDLLEEFGKIKTKLAQFIITAGALDDLVELVLITVLLGFLQTSATKTSLGQLFIGIVVFSFIVVAFRFWIIPWILRLIEQELERSLIFTGALIITLLMSVLAEFLGIGALIGSLFAGILVRQVLLKDAGHKPWERAELTHTIHTVAFGFLVPFFFLNVGLQTNLAAIWDNIWFGLTISFLAIAGTVLGSAIGYRLANGSWQDGFTVGWAMNAKGDTELVIAKFALAAGVISTAVFSSLIFMAVLSTLISPYVLKQLLNRPLSR